ncbi:MAG: glycoside hydrolase family 5 protein [Lachnospiraceae bacterium]
MRRGLHKKVLAGLMSFALALPSGSFIQTGSQRVFAAEEDNTVLDKILGAEDISLRMKWNDKSNIGEEHSVAISSGSIIVKDNGTMRKELTAQQLASTEMGIGINLGNTMEATHPVENKASLTKTDYDKGWGKPVTTREYINCLHSYGINTIRIPVAWSNGDIDDGNYTIRSEMFDRIEEVVNYALDNGMYVIINDHWDNQWWGQFGACKKDEEGNKVVDEETRAAAWTRYESYWTQICARFGKYSDHLIFEGANEELGTRLNDVICLNGPAKGYTKPDNAGAVTEITTTIDNNISKIVEKTTMPDGTQTVKETVSEDVNGIVTIKETLNSNKSNVTLIKNTTKYTDGDIINTDATLYTGNSDINSNYSARNVIPESFLNEAKEAGINNITLCIEKNIVDDVKDNQGKRMVIKIEVPETEGLSVGKVMLSKEAVQGAKESSRRFVVKMVNKNPSKSYTVTIPPSELAKMQGDIDISIKSGKVSETGGNKQENIENILSANGIEAEDAAFVSIASNNTKGGIKASAPVVTQSVKAGGKAYVYNYNSKTGKLYEVANSKRTVLKNGMTGIEGYPGNDYVVTGKELTGKNVVTLLSQSKVTFNKTSLKKGNKLKLNITLPSELEIKTSFRT